MAEKSKTDPVRFFREVRDEGKKVTWTGRQEVFVTTIFVVIMVTLVAIFLMFVDFIAARAVCSAVTLDVMGCLFGDRQGGF